MTMDNVFFQIMIKFGQAVGKEEMFAQSAEIITGIILIMALSCCFFGNKIFRLFSAVIAFFLTAIAICELLQNRAHMGEIVTAFAVIGLAALFTVYHWSKASACLFSALMGYSIAAFFSPGFWACFAAAIILGILSLIFPIMTVTLSSAVWGGSALALDSNLLADLELLNFKIIAAACLAAAGLFIQYMTSRKQLINIKGGIWGRYIT